MKTLRILSVLVVAMPLWSHARGAEIPAVVDAKVVIPRTEDDVRAAHDKAAAQAAIVIPADRPFELKDGEEPLTFDNSWTRRLRGDAEPKLRGDRRPVVAMGMQIAPDDQKQLPYFSSGIILDRVQKYFLCIQVRVVKDATGAAVLAERPVVAVVTFDDLKKTQASIELIDTSIRDIRSLGIITGAATAAVGKSQTLVLLNKAIVAVTDESGVETRRPSYEFILVHARPNAAGTLDLHTFATSHQRQKLHYFQPFTVPKSAEECGILGTVFFTEYSLGGQSPTARATRNVKFLAARAAEKLQIDESLKRRKLDGDAWDNLPTVLDALVDDSL